MSVLQHRNRETRTLAILVRRMLGNNTLSGSSGAPPQRPAPRARLPGQAYTPPSPGHCTKLIMSFVKRCDIRPEWPRGGGGAATCRASRIQRLVRAGGMVRLEPPLRPNGLEPEPCPERQAVLQLVSLGQTPPPGLLWQVARQLTHQKTELQA